MSWGQAWQTFTARIRSHERALRSGVGVALTVAAPALLLANAVDRRWMDDDGFINLRIVRNCLRGYGPVFNIGERVEAATSPLWLAWLALMGELRIRLEEGAVYSGIALTVLALFLAQEAARVLGRARTEVGAHSSYPCLPLGAAVFAVIPAVWDYASSGLETGLGLAWLAGSYLALVRPMARPSAARTCAIAVLLGLGPLIRPEFALYSVAYLGILGFVLRARGVRPTFASVAVVVLSAGAIPGVYEIVRMGYYGAIVPNTAIAKEAFSGNLSQGRCYFDNFFRTYAMAWPLVASAVFWLSDLLADASRRRIVPFVATLAPAVAAVLHVVFIVAIGGDYMHARLFIPAVLAGILPVAMVPVPPLPGGWRGWISVAAIGVVAVWAPICALRLRVRVENVCNIGDERGWYAREAHEANPVEIGAYRAHQFYSTAQTTWDGLVKACHGLSLSGSRSSHRPCRIVMLNEDQQKEIGPTAASFPAAPELEPRVDAVVEGGAIGILGYFLPSSIHVVDRHGLAEPIVARFVLQQRGRPGHEKKLTAPWMLARFAKPSPAEDAAVTAARHALHCGPLASLERAVSGPLTARQVLDNIAQAFTLSRLRIPVDPFDAETQFCKTTPMRSMTTSGPGGTAFRWACPAGQTVTGLRGDADLKEATLKRIQAVCSPPDPQLDEGGASQPPTSSPGDRQQDLVVGPAFGEGKDVSFELACPPESAVVGFYGRADRLAHSIGLICRGAHGSTRTSQGGRETGASFALTCPAGNVLGVTGRSGALIDAVGPLCSPDPTAPRASQPE
jgi:arabinofuranosyltransferase